MNKKNRGTSYEIIINVAPNVWSILSGFFRIHVRTNFYIFQLLLIVVPPSLYDVQWLMEVLQAVTEDFDAHTCMSHYYKLSSDLTSQDRIYVDSELEIVINY